MRAPFLTILFLVPAILFGGQKPLGEYEKHFNDADVNKYYYARCIAEFGDLGVRWLLSSSSGSSDEELQKAIGIGLLYAPIDVLPYIKPMLKDNSPQVRAFAVCVAAILVDERFIPFFNALSADKSELPEGWYVGIDGLVNEAMWMFKWKNEYPECFKECRDHMKAKTLESWREHLPTPKSSRIEAKTESGPRE